MEDPGLFTLPCRLGDSKPFDTLADLGSCVNIIPLYLFKKLNIGLLEETDHIFGLADGTKSYLIGIVKDVEVHIGRKAHLLEDKQIPSVGVFDEVYARGDLVLQRIDVPTRQILGSKGAISSMKAADAKKSMQDMADHSQKWHNKTSTRTRSIDTSDGLAVIEAQLNNLGREIKKTGKYLKKHTTLNLEYHSHKEEDIEQLL
ncbi:ribosomal protein [Tanacetum coccineum]